MAKQSLKTAETDALRICMIQRDLTVKNLATDCGIAPITLSNQISKNFPSLRLRLIVEDVLKIPIWSSVNEFEHRQKIILQYGFNPVVLSMAKLRQKAANFKIKGRSKCRRKQQFITLLCEK